jgi:hypothetical protein
VLFRSEVKTARPSHGFNRLSMGLSFSDVGHNNK